MSRSSTSQQIEEQRTSNLSAVGYYDAFAEHRKRLTALIASKAGGASPLRLCVLGAGNCYDLDLAELSSLFGEIHLVDVDASALERAKARLDGEMQARIFCHAPLDVSGIFPDLERWRALDVTLEELTAAPHVASNRVIRALPGPFDVVLSACVLTQLQLAVLNVLGDRHRLFEAVRLTLNLIHLRTLLGLVAPEGSALLVSDVASNLDYPLDKLDPKTDLSALLNALVRNGKVIYAANPSLLARSFRDDPVLRRSARLSGPEVAWLWQNGPERTFLVYALELSRAPAAPAPAHENS